MGGKTKIKYSQNSEFHAKVIINRVRENTKIHRDSRIHYNCLIFFSKNLRTIPDKIFGTKWSNPVNLDRKRKVWYLFLRVFQLLFTKSKFLKGD